jgi:phosphinothricin acetyltransferase
VAENSGRISGFITFGTFRAGPGYAATCEHSIIVRPGEQGQGVGRALMARGEAAAQGLGLHVMVAAISGANPEAIRFHDCCGFREVGRMPDVGRKAGQWLELVLMQKILSGKA